MTTITFIGLFIIVGFVFLAIEFLLVPGFSVPGLAGIAMIGYGIFKASKAYGYSGTVITVVVSVAISLILMRIVLKTRAVKSIGLDYDQKGTSAVDDYSFLVGKQGKAISDLRTSGIAIIEGNRYDVVTDGEYIDENASLIVEKIEGTRILVTKTKRG